LGVGRWELWLCLVLVNILRQPFQLLEEHERPMRRNFETLPTRSARDVIIDADQVVFALAEQRFVAIVGAGRNLGLLRATHPPHRVVIGATAARALETGRPLFRFLGEELTLVHASERTTLNWKKRLG